jgi:high affinity Mn2+ porin
VRTLLIVLALLGGVSEAAAQDPASDPPAQATIVPHPDHTWWWLSGQVNIIEQAHGAFTSPYEGDNSLRAAREQALSRVWTIYTGAQIGSRTELLFDVESAGGRGIGDALGLGGFTNLDVVRNPSLGSRPYVARLMIHYTIPLSGDTTPATRGALSLATIQRSRRLELRAGKLGLVDFFDLNASGSDSHLQFTNWTIDNNGAYDYAADTRGYTYGAIVEYDSPQWDLRFAEALMPTVANGITLDWDIARARGENFELELHQVKATVIRLLAYQNHANMGSYDEAIRAYQEGLDRRPDIEAHRRQGRTKYGVGANIQYAWTENVRLFARSGWNEGHNESFAYTEVNNSVQGGADAAGTAWGRPQDRVGAAVVSNGLSDAHREYLQLGGLGFVLGDGTLRYGRERIVETYYTAPLAPGVFVSAGAQYVVNPGYNRDRGPVLVGSVRLHLDF